MVATTGAPMAEDGDFGLFFPPADPKVIAASSGGAVDHGAHAHHNHNGDAHAHQNHNGGAHGAGAHGGHEMKMWFHGGYSEVILFDFWKIDSLYGLILSCVIIFIMAAAYEGLKWFRVYLQMSAKRRGERASPLLNGNANGGSDVYCPTTTPPVITVRGRRSPSISVKGKASALGASRLIDAALYVIQLTMAYCLMLVAMTYNTYLTAAVVLGAGFGHWLFAAMDSMTAEPDQADAFTSDACH
uniref:Copper transport protein n=1 Tax=Steinernema glaseri TaxID=37863 RepID=A0A1I8ASY3_9BILA